MLDMHVSVVFVGEAALAAEQGRAALTAATQRARAAAARAAAPATPLVFSTLAEAAAALQAESNHCRKL